MEDFQTQLIQSVEKSIISFLKSGDWFKIDYNSRVNIDSAFLRSVLEKVDMNLVAERVKENVEQKIADSIINSMATEIATDVKSIMSNKELREDLRSIIRTKIRTTHKTLSE